MRRTFLFLGLVMVVSFSAQVKENFTYTLNSAYEKELKKYPLITKAVSENSENLEVLPNITFKNIDGKELKLDAFLVKNLTSAAAVILIHGGGWKSGSRDMLNPLAQEIAKYGYNSFTIDYRLSDEAKYPAAIDDVLEALVFLKKNARKFKIDTTKIALLGCSSGGQMAALIGTKYPNAASAIIDIDGILAFHHPDSQEGALAAHWLGGNYEESPAVWKEASALTHVSAKTPPFLFINSQYIRFSAGQNEMVSALKSHNIPAEVQKIENSPHTFWLFNPWFSPTVNYIKNFLNLNFKKNEFL